jgi:hypothetical protein
MTQRGRHRAPARHAKPKDSLRKIQISLIALGVCAAGVSAKAQTVPSHLAADSGNPRFVNVKALTDSAAEGTIVRHGSVQTGTKIVSHRVKYKVIVKRDKSLPKGKKVVRRSGASGKAMILYRVRSVNGIVVSRSQVRRSIVVAPTTKVIAIGVAAPTADPTASAVAVPPGSAKAFAQSYIADKYGWGNDQFGCLVQLWERESHWNTHAHNSGSGAHGIPQAMPGSKMASAGPDWYNNAETQVKWGANYISGRYGNPCGALGHSNSTGWY